MVLFHFIQVFLEKMNSNEFILKLIWSFLSYEMLDIQFILVKQFVQGVLINTHTHTHHYFFLFYFIFCRFKFKLIVFVPENLTLIQL